MIVEDLRAVLLPSRLPSLVEACWVALRSLRQQVRHFLVRRVLRRAPRQQVHRQSRRLPRQQVKLFRPLLSQLLQTLRR